MPHPTRTLVGGDEVQVIFLSLWVDDVSGNVSKQYNKHINVYATNGNLPGRMLSQEYHVHFVSTSQHAKAAEQLSEILRIIQWVYRKRDGLLVTDFAQRYQCQSRTTQQSTAHVA